MHLPVRPSEAKNQNGSANPYPQSENLFVRDNPHHSPPAEGFAEDRDAHQNECP